MNRLEFQELMRTEFRALLDTNDRKGHDYAGDDDALANFKRIAERMGLAPEQVWGVYAGKHWDSIMTYVREGAVQSEPIEGRIHDLILYGLLLLGLVKEAREREENPVSIFDLDEPLNLVGQGADRPAKVIPVRRVDHPVLDTGVDTSQNGRLFEGVFDEGPGDAA